MSNKKTKNYRPLYLLLSFLSIFGLFVFVLTCKSDLQIAKNELPNCKNIEEVRLCWTKHENKLSQNEDFENAVREKLNQLTVSDSQLVKINDWLPKPPTYLNVILVPDLSRRIIDTFNNPAQIKNDTTLLNTVWESFVENVKLKSDSKDKLIVDVTDGTAAVGKFKDIANDLVFDLSTHKDKSNKLYFNKQGNRFSKNIDSLYSMSKKKPQGADYWLYFKDNLSNRVKKNTIHENYRNLVIIITDGYLESETKYYTGYLDLHNAICSDIKSGKKIENIFEARKIKIEPLNLNFSNVEVLMLEVNERKVGIGCHFDILKKYWKDWFVSMQIKVDDNNFFIRRDNAISQVQDKIRKFIKSKN